MTIADYALSSTMAGEHRRLASKYAKIVPDATYTILAADLGRRLWFTSGSTVNITVPSGLPAWFECEIVQKGAGQLVFAAGPGATLSAYSGWLKSAGQHAGMILANNGGTDTLTLLGQITA